MLMDYRIKRVGQSDELEHALFGIGKKKSSSSSGSGSGQQGAKKGSTWSNHLYIARQKAGDGWRYFYSQAELQAAKAKGAAKQAAKTVGDTARKGLATVKRAGSKAADIASGKYARDIDQNISRRKEYIDTRNNIANASAERWMDTQKQIDANKAHGDAVAADLRKRAKDLEDIEKVYGKKSEQYRVMNEDASKVADELNNYSKEAKRLETKSKKNADAARPWWNEDLEQRKKLAAEETARDNDTAYKVSKFFNNPKAELKKAGEKAKANIDDGVAKVKRAVKDTARDVEWAVDDAKDVVKNTAKKIKNEASDVLSGEYKKKIDEDYNRTQEDQRRRYNTDERLNKKASEYRQKRDDAGPIFNEDGTKNLEFFNNNDKLTETLLRDQDNSSKIKENREKIAELDKERSSIKYGAATAISKATAAINKGKSAVSKLIGDTKDAAGKAITTASDKAKNLADKGKAAVDKLGKVLSGEYHKEVDLEGDRINEAMIKSNRTAKRLSGSSNIDKDNELLAYTSIGGRAQKHADETMDYASKQYLNNLEKGQSPYKVSKVIAGAKDKVEESKAAAGKAITTASDKAKNLADKGKAAVDKLGKVLSGEYHKEVDLEGDRINEAMIKSNRTAKRLSGSSNIDKDNELLAYTSIGGRAQKHADETMDYASKQYLNNLEKGQSPYKVSKVIAGAKDKVEESKAAAGKAIEKAQEDFYETRRDVREFAAKAKNFVTDKTYRNDKTYRDMVDGVKSMQEDLKSIDAYIRELKASPKMTPSIEKEIKEARALQDEIGNTMVSVRREVEKYKNN